MSIRAGADPPSREPHQPRPTVDQGCQLNNSVPGKFRPTTLSSLSGSATPNRAAIPSSFPEQDLSPCLCFCARYCSSSTSSLPSLHHPPLLGAPSPLLCHSHPITKPFPSKVWGRFPQTKAQLVTFLQRVAFLLETKLFAYVTITVLGHQQVSGGNHPLNG